MRHMEKSPYQGLVFEWYKRFLGGGEDEEDDRQPGSPVTMKTNENVRTDHRLGSRMIVEELNMDK
jgi:hypothetical protein